MVHALLGLNVIFMTKLKKIIKLNDNHWLVRSDRNVFEKYHVRKKDGLWYCGCPHFVFRQEECKHIDLVKKEVNTT